MNSLKSDDVAKHFFGPVYKNLIKFPLRFSIDRFSIRDLTENLLNRDYFISVAFNPTQYRTPK